MHQNIRFVQLAAAVALAAGLITACQPNTVSRRDFPSGAQAALVDRTLGSDAACALPCWHGITPGKTTFDEAVTQLKSLPFVGEVLPYPQSHEIQWTSAITAWGGGVVTFDDHNVAATIITTLEYHLTAQELIELLGEPDGVAIFDMHAPEQDPFGEVRMLWPGRGLMAVIAVYNLNQSLYATHPPVEPGTRIDQVILVKSDPSTAAFVADFKDRYHPWAGYKPLKQQ